MKKLMLTALAVVSFISVKAQDGETAGFAKGDIFISGAVGYDSSTFGDNKDNTFTIAPRAGYFVSENIAVGARIGFTSSTVERVGTADFDTNTFNIGAFGRYYFTPSSKFSVFGEFGLDYLSRNEDNGTTDLDSNGFSVGGGPGVSYFIGNNFALEAFWGALRYNTLKADVSGAESQDDFEFGVNLDDITLGLVYKF
ncbi:porin family protein [Aquimarina aquimarini]|uniref:porin family protein n=1 Tax=Aquimarina aquimarini TaxID=1191734 RepID=UPI000D55BE33|nr:porin family protein [Aquimarina aquimarini]